MMRICSFHPDSVPPAPFFNSNIAGPIISSRIQAHPVNPVHPCEVAGPLQRPRPSKPSYPLLKTMCKPMLIADKHRRIEARRRWSAIWIWERPRGHCRRFGDAGSRPWLRGNDGNKVAMVIPGRSVAECLNLPSHSMRQIRVYPV